MESFKYNYSYKPVIDQEQIKQKEISPIEINLLKPNCGNAFTENCCYMFMQIAANVGFWIGIVMLKQSQTGSNTAAIVLMVVGVLLSFILICCGKMRKYLENVQSLEETKTYCEKIRHTNPIIQYYTEAYHYQQDREGRSQMVVSWRNTSQLNYQNCIDITPDISKVLAQCKLVRFDTKLVWHPGNQLTANNWHNLGEFEKNIARRQDQMVTQRETSTIPGQLGEILVFSENKPCYLSIQMYYFFHLLQVGSLYDMLIYNCTGHFTLKAQKIVIQLEGLVLSANNQQFSNFADQQQLNMFNQMNFNNQMPMMMANPGMNQPMLQNNFAAQQNPFAQQPQQMPMNYVHQQQLFMQQQGQPGQQYLEQPNLAQQYPLQPQQQFQNPNQNYMNQYPANQMAPNQMAANQINPNQFAPQYTLP